jgi:hypothetical protein
LQVAFERLNWAFHYSSLEKQVRQSSDIDGIQKVNLEKEPEAHVVAIEWDTFDQGDMRNKGRLLVVCIPPIAKRQSMVGRNV